MQFIAMDLIGPFHPPTVDENEYALTVVDMLTGFAWAFPLHTKTAKEVVDVYIRRVYSGYGGSQKILSDNGTEFKNKLFEDVAVTLGTKYKVYTAPYNPEGNGKVECFHNFLKPCLGKYLTERYSWDRCLHIATAAHNFLPSTATSESPFFLMFARDPLLPLQDFLMPRPRYMGDEDGYIQLDLLRKAFALAAYNLTRHYDADADDAHPPPFKIGTPVMIKNHTKNVWEPLFSSGWRIIDIESRTKVQIQDAEGHVRTIHVRDIVPTTPIRKIKSTIPETEIFGRAAKNLYHPDQLPVID